MRIDHVGYIVKNVNKAMNDFKALGYSVRSETCYDEIRHADIVFLENGGYVVELVAPKGEASVVWHLLKRNGAGPYHICYITNDLEADGERLANAGFVRTVDAQEAPALGGRRVSFYTGRNAGMVELLEEESK